MYLINLESFSGLDNVVRGAAFGEEPFKFFVTLDDVRVQYRQIVRLLAKAFLDGCELQDLGNVAQVSTLKQK